MYSFIAFDVVEFYPSIPIELLSEALQFASEYHTITDNEQHIILQAKSSLLHSYGEPWGKKTSSNQIKTYVGLTETSFKTRFANHKSSFNDPSKRLSTERSKHVRHLKEERLKFGISWKILKQTTGAL